MKKYILLFGVALTFFSCKEINEKRQFFGEWLVLKKEQKNEDGTFTDITKNCDLDDNEAYRNMGTWYYEPGKEKCEDAELPTLGKWNYDRSNKRIVYSNSANMNVSEAYVVSIDGDGMVLDFRNSSVEHIVRITYKKVK